MEYARFVDGSTIDMCKQGVEFTRVGDAAAIVKCSQGDLVGVMSRHVM